MAAKLNQSDLFTANDTPGGRGIGRRLPARDAELALFTDLMDSADAAALFAELLHHTQWERHRIRLHGREFDCPRLSAWYGDQGLSYAYSGLTVVARGWNEPLLAIRRKVEAVSGHRFNSVLLNLYRNGDDSMGWHSDDERELGRNPVVASVSLGAHRRFKLRHKNRLKARTEFLDLELPHNSLLLMSGSTQHHWRHALPNTRKPVAERINLTFRQIRTMGMLTT